MENFNIIKEKENSLFKRKEIEFNIDSVSTPNREEVIKFVSAKFSSQPETIKIKGIHGSFGSRTFTVKANVYSSEKDKDETEPKKKKEQSKFVEEKPAEEKPVEQPQEQPAEPEQEQKPGEKIAEFGDSDMKKDNEQTQSDKGGADDKKSDASEDDNKEQLTKDKHGKEN